MKNDAMQELLEQYRKKLPEKIFHLRTLIGNLKSSSSQETLKEIISAIHKLAGSAGTYGLMEISIECKKKEKELQHLITHFDKGKVSTSFFDDLIYFIEALERLSTEVRD